MSDEQEQVTMPEMDLGEAESQRPPSEGWHPAIVFDVSLTYSKEDMDLPAPSRRRNFVIRPELASDDPEMPGYKPGNLYIPIPTEVETAFHQKYKAATKQDKAEMLAGNPEMFSSDGRTKYSQKMDWIKKAASAFGGKESGKFDKNFFVKQIGQRFMVNIEHQEWQGEIQGRCKFMGIKPA